MPGVVNQKATSTPCTALEVEPPSLTSPSRMKTPERPSTPRAMSPNKTKHYVRVSLITYASERAVNMSLFERAHQSVSVSTCRLSHQYHRYMYLIFQPMMSP